MIKRFLQLVILGTVVAIAMGFFGFVHPALDTIANFRWHLSVGLLALALLSLAYFDRWKSFIITLIALGGWISCFMPLNSSYIQPEPQIADSPHKKEYSLLHLNLYYANPTPQKVFDLIKRTNPDIMTFNEFSGKWKQRLKILDKDYPFSYHCPEWSVIGGSIIYSRLPMSKDDGYCHAYAALALKDVMIDDRKVSIGSVHLRWPWPASGPRQVDSLKPVLQKLAPDTLIAGDLNSTSWTWLVRRFAKYGSLRIVRYTGASWIYRSLPTSLAKWLGLSLDNAMAKGRVSISSAQTLAPVGSDHLPLIIRFYVD